MTRVEALNTENFDKAPTFDDINLAAQRLRGWAVETPLLESSMINEVVKGRVLLKAETFQRTGSFKFRGAFNRISQIPEAKRENGVVAYSSGNHAQGVAAAAAITGIPAVIVMPADAPAIKVENTRSFGAEVVLYDRRHDSREEIGRELTEQRRATLVRPYDDPGIIAGQGTCGMEIVSQARAIDAKLDSLLVCCGGGGLTAGCAIALEELSPETEVLTVEPSAFDDTKRSITAGEIVANSGHEASICDALLAPQPGMLTFSINRKRISRGLSVTDTEVKAAMAFAFRNLKLVVEPGGAVCLAAVLSGKFDCAGRTVALTLSGGNVDAELYRTVLAEHD
ncbi:threonine/serine dehydratase [Pelagibius litoralis]|uniref:Threonine/serine dehydratase n=2 Tax=Pelagibius litoralis TaxID=374515 RepID=A0A967C2E0_9PROT|nr:threonine/serine dehydratase [Pelagibius litoralis]